MKKYKVTERELARELNVHRNTIYRWMVGDGVPPDSLKVRGAIRKLGKAK